jgi:hypothetical protein
MSLEVSAVPICHNRGATSAWGWCDASRFFVVIPDFSDRVGFKLEVQSNRHKCCSALSHADDFTPLRKCKLSVRQLGRHVVGS